MWRCYISVLPPTLKGKVYMILLIIFLVLFLAFIISSIVFVITLDTPACIACIITFSLMLVFACFFGGQSHSTRRTYIYPYPYPYLYSQPYSCS